MYCFRILFAEKYPEEESNVFFYLWISASVFSSLYSYIWDIKMDWGLFDRNAGENRFLREEIVYSSTVNSTFSLLKREQKKWPSDFCWHRPEYPSNWKLAMETINYDFDIITIRSEIFVLHKLSHACNFYQITCC